MFDLVTAEQLEKLRGLYRRGERIRACELVAVRWPAPDGTRHYACAPFDRMPNFHPLADRGLSIDDLRVQGYFIDLPFTSEVNDDSIPLELLDDEREVTRLLRTHGAGHQVEVYYYFPQINALVSLWWGHLRPPREGGQAVLKLSAASGFRSLRRSVPSRILYTGACQAVYPVGVLTTQAEIDEGACPVNLHIGGAVGLPDPATGQPYPTCPQDSRAECAKRIGDDLSFYAADTVVESIVNHQTKGPALLARSQGNETNLKEPLPRVYGERWLRDLQVSALIKQFNTRHPDKGFVRVQVPGCEGRIKSMTQCSVNEVTVGFEHLNVRLGALRQARTGFSPTASNLSGTAHFFAVHGQVDPAPLSASNLRGKCKVEGAADVRVYTSETEFTEQYTTLRSWCLLDLYRSPRFGMGKKLSRFEIEEDWMTLAAWDAQTVKYKRADGTVHTVPRSNFSAHLVGRPSADQIRDICLFGRYGLPFRHNGKVRQVALKKEAIDDSIPVFTDEGPGANIQITKEGSQLFWSQIDPAELVNQIVLTFEDRAHNNIERPLTFNDRPAQKAAAAALGDTGLHVVPKPYSAVGITDEGEAIRWAWMCLALGEFDEGGLKNNLRVRFVAPFFEVLNLRRYQLIKVVSRKIDGFGFEYFRVMDRRRRGDLFYEIIAQAYPADYYEEMEDVGNPPVLFGGSPGANPGGRPGDRPELIGFSSLTHTADRVLFTLQQSALAA